jgi:hypothetical protein
VLFKREAERVFSTINGLLDDLAAPSPYRCLFDLALNRVRERADQQRAFLPVDVPLAVSEVLGLPASRASTVTAACVLIWGGADLLDDIADGDLSSDWAGVSPHQLTLVATNMLATLPHLLCQRLAQDGVSDASLAELSARISRALWQMSVGQSRDLDQQASAVSHEDYLTLVGEKTGAQVSLYAALPAVVAEREASETAAWEQFGRAYGTMAQLFSDVTDMFCTAGSRDLANGKRTEPVFQTLSALDDAERAEFVSLLDAAKLGDRAAAEAVCELVVSTGSLRFSLLTVELFRFRALQALPLEPSNAMQNRRLRALLEAFGLPANSEQRTPSRPVETGVE